MKKIIACLLVVLVATPVAFAQETFRKLPHPQLEAQEALPQDERRKIDLTHEGVNSPEGQAALAAFHQARAAGLLPRANKSAQSYTPGERRIFNVRVDVRTTQAWEQLEFELKDTSAVARIWVDPNQLVIGNITEDDIALLSVALLRQTASGSFNEGQGIVANSNEVFGDPPNFDGDGITDILIYDIQEGDPTQCCVLGFFSPTDLNPNATSDQGNQADVIYLDAKEGTSSVVILLSVAAHEYQHLIHANYHVAPVSSVNEGLSEWAYLLNGYIFARSYNYLRNPGQHNRPLVTSTPVWQNTNADYERAGLFTTYLAEQIGTLKAGAITRAAQSGVAAYTEVLADEALTLEDVIANFHVTNFVNDDTLQAPFGYTNQFLQAISASPTVLYNGDQTSVTERVQASVESGGVQYLVWDNVEDFEIFLDARAAQVVIEFQRARMRPHIVLESADGSLEVRALPPSPNFRTFAGTYARVAVVVPGVQAGSATSVAFDYEARWTGGQGGGGGGQGGDNVAISEYGNGEFNAFFPLGDGGIVATRFAKPQDDAVLRSVDVGALYINQFANTNVPESAPRNMQVLFFDQNNNREPGTELFRMTLDDPREYRGQSTLTVDFLTIDLSAQADQMAALPDTFFVGFMDAGDDNNLFVVGASPYTVSNVSFASPPGQDVWIPFWNLALVNDAGDRQPIGETALPMRATFELGVGVVSNAGFDEIPRYVTLDANYPNPFNPNTTIQYHLPQADHVQLAVYDLLGQRMTTLVDEPKGVGTHTVHVDASGWASGVYVYALEVGDERTMRKMILLK